MLYEAAKKLNEILFGNRPVIIVNQFESECFYVLRMPIGFKIATNCVCGDISRIDPISTIVDSSRALAELSINVTEELVFNFQHNFVKNAKCLSICTHEEMIDQLVGALQTMENQRIHIGFLQYDNPSANHYFRLIQGWMSTGRCVGSVITFELRTDQIGEEILELGRTRNERTESTERCVRVPLGVGTILEVFYCGVNIENSPEFLLTARVMEA